MLEGSQSNLREESLFFKPTESRLDGNRVSTDLLTQKSFADLASSTKLINTGPQRESPKAPVEKALPAGV